MISAAERTELAYAFVYCGIWDCAEVACHPAVIFDSFEVFGKFVRVKCLKCPVIKLLGNRGYRGDAVVNDGFK